jgi:uncharacterized protein involved in exopolysaccharide biosynthesis
MSLGNDGSGQNRSGEAVDPATIGRPREPSRTLCCDLREHLIVLFRHKWRILGTLLVTVLVAGGGSLLLTKVYRSEIRILVRSSREPLQVDAMARGFIVPKDYVKSEVSIFESRLLVERLIERLGADTVLEAMSGRSVLKFESPDPEFAAMALNTLAELYLAHHLEVRRGEGTSLRDADVSLIEPAPVPWRSVRPRTKLNLLLGIIVGLIGGISRSISGAPLRLGSRSRRLSAVPSGPRSRWPTAVASRPRRWRSNSDIYRKRSIARIDRRECVAYS